MNSTFYKQNQRKQVVKSAQPLFKRLSENKQSQSRVSRFSKAQKNLPTLAKMRSTISGISLSSSKQNLTIQTFLQKVTVGPSPSQQSIVSSYLTNLRKDYDKMHKESRQHQSTINLKKKDIQFMRERVRIQEDEVKKIQERVKKGQQQIQKVRQKQQSVQTQKRTLNHIINRMKQDEIFYKQFSIHNQANIHQNQKNVKSITLALLHQQQKIHKLLSTIQNTKAQFQRIHQSREKKLQDYCQRLQDIHDRQAFLKERKERTQELQSIQSNDVLKAKNVEMKNICLVNKVADCLFQCKIQSLIKSYSKVQDAFHTIQVKTSISDPSLLASKFFSYEQVTQNLLKSINHFQKQLSQKQSLNQKLKQEYKKLEQKSFIEGTNKNINDANQSNQQKKQIQQQRKKQVMRKILDWMDRNGKRMKILEQEQGQPLHISSKLEQICLKTKHQMQQIQKTLKSYQRKYVTPGIRIKKVVKQITLDAKTQKVKQAQQLMQSNVAEDQYLKQTRMFVKRNFLIKQKTINFGAHTKDKKNETLNSDRRIKTSDYK